MALSHKPNTLVVRPKVLEKDGDGVALSGGFGDPVTVSCLAHAEQPGTVYEETGLEAVRPYRIFVDLSDLPNFPIGSEITDITGSGVTVEAGPLYVRWREPFAHGMGTDHVDIICSSEAE